MILGIVAAGVRRYGVPSKRSSGNAGNSAYLRDPGIGLASWFAALVSVSILGSPTAPPDQSIRFLLPESLLEACWWIGLSVVAGISEEAVYRGYLQTQFTGLTNSHSMGIFGFGSRVRHGPWYQGPGRASVIAGRRCCMGLSRNGGKVCGRVCFPTPHGTPSHRRWSDCCGTENTSNYSTRSMRTASPSGDFSINSSLF